MQKTTGLIVIFYLLYFVALGQNNTQTLTDFEILDVRGGFDVYIIPHNTNKIEIDAQNPLWQHTKAEVKGNTLFIYLAKPEVWYGKGEKDEIKITIYSKNIQQIQAQASADIIGTDLFEPPQLYLKVTSGSSIQLNLQTPKMDCQLWGASGLYLKGAIKELSVDNQEGSWLEGTYLTADRATLRCSSGAWAKLQVKQYLKANASTGALIEYIGNPDTDFTNEWGGQIIKR